MKNAYVLLFLAIVAEVAATSFESGKIVINLFSTSAGHRASGRASTQASARSG
jgi:hypothetical protein